MQDERGLLVELKKIIFESKVLMPIFNKIEKKKKNGYETNMNYNNREDFLYERMILR